MNRNEMATLVKGMIDYSDEEARYLRESSRLLEIKARNIEAIAEVLKSAKNSLEGRRDYSLGEIISAAHSAGVCTPSATK